jgi:uncharacterized protein with PQ loop repeat
MTLATTRTTATATTTAVLEFARSHPDWPVRFLAVYAGNPIIFVAYFVAMSNHTGEDGLAVLGIKTFRTVETNTSWMNPFVFVLITFPLYLLWFYAQISWIVPGLLSVCRSSRTLSIDRFCVNYAGIGALIAAAPGLLNAFVWITSGMEGNIMGFIFALPLLVATGAYVVMWFVVVCTSLEYRPVSSYDSDDNNGDEAAIAMSPVPVAYAKAAGREEAGGG